MSENAEVAAYVFEQLVRIESWICTSEGVQSAAGADATTL
jgi:hypothetical protein